jgi:SprB repeat/Secretion system C-terminal sorting domain
LVPQAMEPNATFNNVSCFGETDGSITINVTGGAGSYTYLWDNGETNPFRNNLGTGTYSVQITDAAGCSFTHSISIVAPSALTATIVQITPETTGNQNGAIDVTVAGGTAPYSFEWSDASGNILSTPEDLGNIAAGTYTLKVTDAKGCTSLHVFTVQSVSSTTHKEFERRILLFPNPSNGLVTLALDGIDVMEADIQVFEMTGKLTDSYRNADVSSGMFVMDMAGYADGIFLVRIMIENQIVVKRLVIQK